MERPVFPLLVLSCPAQDLSGIVEPNVYCWVDIVVSDAVRASPDSRKMV